MIIDILFLLVMVFAIFKGIRKGLVIAIFSLAGWIIGLAAALKLSAVAAGYLSDSLNIGARWLPVLSFILVFIVVLLLIRIGAQMIEKAIQLILLGWANRIAGAVLYIFFHAVIFSVLLFFAEQVKLLKPDTIAASVVYPWIKPVGPWAISAVSVVIPLFRDVFRELQDFFEKISHRIGS